MHRVVHADLSSLALPCPALPLLALPLLALLALASLFTLCCSLPNSVAVDAAHAQQPQYIEIGLNAAIAAPMEAATVGHDAVATATEAGVVLSTPPIYSLPMDGEPYKVRVHDH